MTTSLQQFHCNTAQLPSPVAGKARIHRALGITSGKHTKKRWKITMFNG
jgi:hypothetical protein